MSASTQTRRLATPSTAKVVIRAITGSERALEVVEPDEASSRSTSTPTASKRSSVVPRAVGRSGSQAAAILRTWACLAGCRLSNGSPDPSRRVLTSQNTSVRPSESTRSSSPQRVWWLWASTW